MSQQSYNAAPTHSDKIASRNGEGDWCQSIRSELWVWDWKRWQPHLRQYKLLSSIEKALVFVFPIVQTFVILPITKTREPHLSHNNHTTHIEVSPTHHKMTEEPSNPTTTMTKESVSSNRTGSMEDTNRWLLVTFQALTTLLVVGATLGWGPMQLIVSIIVCVGWPLHNHHVVSTVSSHYTAWRKPQLWRKVHTRRECRRNRVWWTN